MSKVRVRGWWIYGLLAFMVMAVPWPAWFIEPAYSRGMYPRLQRIVTDASNRPEWAVVDVMLALVTAYVLLLIVRFIMRVRESGVATATWESARRIVRTSALIVLVFFTNWGLNYRRVSLEDTLRGGVPATVGTAEIRALAEHSITGTHATRPEAVQYDRALAPVAVRLADPFQRALKLLGMPATVVGRPKVSKVLSPFFMRAGVTGMVNPFALETVVYPGLLPFERPMVLAHEWAHLAGFADEADASAVAWLACMLGPPDLAYSAHLFVVLEAASAVPSSVWQELRPKLDAGVLEDIAALRERLKRQEPAVRDTAFKVYDRYLKTNGVEDGVRSYSRMLRVIVAMPTVPTRP